ncbi:substrate-binding periplasmic protein [Suttonella ornithocola]|uniref:ABC transporter arginine-binding protein 1 n=1 Tax=Suttonella ornithocola TaxID=279832 RepID=A0A380MSL0_9GAMM|nr:transporter substrate-binding domain-containing protein [Suttonella ornithocola]SUO94327.1 ABC transporter arginine-binding protein 1 precursor [Suttonella ornithocola]
MKYINYPFLITFIKRITICFCFVFYTQSYSQNVKPVYNIITDMTNSPYEFDDGTGNIIGFDVDLMQAIADREGFDFKIKHRSWKNIFELLNNTDADIIMAAITITPQRAKLVDFTVPYIHPTRTAVMIDSRAKALGVTDFDSLRNVTISMKDKTTNLSSLQEMFGDSDKFRPVISQYFAFQKMMAGGADVGFGDTLVMQHYMQRFPEIKFFTLVQPLEERVRAGFAVKKGNKALKEKLDRGIKSIKADGTFTKIATKWFGESVAKNLD